MAARDLRSVYDAGYRTDPSDALSVLAFVLCPPAALVPELGSALARLDPADRADEIAAVAELVAPAKLEAVERWLDVRDAHRVN